MARRPYLNQEDQFLAVGCQALGRPIESALLPPVGIDPTPFVCAFLPQVVLVIILMGTGLLKAFDEVKLEVEHTIKPDVASIVFGIESSDVIIGVILFFTMAKIVF
eukprot:6886276-Prymnesium_polylepis.1